MSHEDATANDNFKLTHLRKGLRKRNLMALRDEVADGKGVFDGGARGEALVSHVKEGEELLFLLGSQISTDSQICIMTRNAP
jgi:hypothetical protein